MKNRRNYYRILHVQPDAPLPIIKASYRTLLNTLRQHPDLGGRNWNACLINEAFEVLSSVRKRAEYDKQLCFDTLRQQDQIAKSVNYHQTQHLIKQYCLFCKTPFLAVEGMPSFEDCKECSSPLTRLSHSEVDKVHQRISERMPKSQQLAIYTFWPDNAKLAYMDNLSTHGLRFHTPQMIPEGHVIKCESDEVQAVACVKHSQAHQHLLHGAGFTIGVEFLAVKFVESLGNFVSLRV